MNRRQAQTGADGNPELTAKTLRTPRNTDSTRRHKDTSRRNQGTKNPSNQPPRCKGRRGLETRDCPAFRFGKQGLSQGFPITQTRILTAECAEDAEELLGSWDLTLCLAVGCLRLGTWRVRSLSLGAKKLLLPHADYTSKYNRFCAFFSPNPLILRDIPEFCPKRGCAPPGAGGDSVGGSPGGSPPGSPPGSPGDSAPGSPPGSPGGSVGHSVGDSPGDSVGGSPGGAAPGAPPRAAPGAPPGAPVGSALDALR
jgi:hypothetical protein